MKSFLCFLGDVEHALMRWVLFIISIACPSINLIYSELVVASSSCSIRWIFDHHPLHHSSQQSRHKWTSGVKRKDIFKIENLWDEKDIYDKDWSQDTMLEDASLRKMKALLATSNRLPPWSSVVNQYSQEQVSLLETSTSKTPNSRFRSSDPSPSPFSTSSLAASLLGCLRQKHLLLRWSLGCHSDFYIGRCVWQIQARRSSSRQGRGKPGVATMHQPSSQPTIQPTSQPIWPQCGSRLDKINSLVKKGQPLKQWSCRGMGEVKARLEVEKIKDWWSVGILLIRSLSPKNERRMMPSHCYMIKDC